jgi:hypothetical protein
MMEGPLLGGKFWTEPSIVDAGKDADEVEVEVEQEQEKEQE